MPACCTSDDPFWWSEPELALLQGTRLHKAASHYTTGLQQLNGWLIRLEELHHQHLQHSQQQQQPCCSSLAGDAGGWGLSLSAVKWARSAVWSRAFTVRGLDIGSNRVAAAAQEQRTTEAAAAGDGDAAGALAGDGDGVAAGSSSGHLSPVIALVPVLDMCDHKPEQRVSWRTVRLQDKQQQQQGAGDGQQQAGQQAFQFTSLSAVRKVNAAFPFHSGG